MKSTYYKALTALGFLLLFCSRQAFSGDFTHLGDTDEHSIYSYEGAVNEGDADKLRSLDRKVSKELVVIIDSPGGAAYEGVELYWVAKELKVTTFAGKKFGAYSAAAMFWAGGSGDMMEGSLAGFHLAYCNPYNPPGCYTPDIDAEMLKCLLDKFGRKRAIELTQQMLTALDTYGVNGFVMFKCIGGEMIVKVEDPTTYLKDFAPPAALPFEGEYVAQVAPGNMPITRFTSVPFISRHKTFRVELSAYHESGIRGVAFIIEGRTFWVDKATPGPTGYMEYALKVNPYRYKGTVEVQAVVYPNEGPARVLKGNSTRHADVKNGGNAFYFNVGNDLVVPVGPSREFKTVGEAIAFHGDALSRGGTIVLDPGYHMLDMPKLDNDGFALTINGRNRAVIINPDSEIRANKGSFHYHRCLFEMDIDDGRFFRGNKDGRLMITRSVAECLDPDGYRKQGQILGKSVDSDWSRGFWCEDVELINIWKGPQGVACAKRVTMDRNTGDCFGSSPGAIIDCAILGNVKDETFHSQHCDIVQFSTGEVTNNRIVADLYAPNCRSQIGHLSQTDKMKDIAFVNWIIDAREAFRSPDINMNPDIDHLFIKSVWLYGGSFAWKESTMTNVHISDVVMEKQTIDAFPFELDADLEIRFTRRMNSDWGPGCVLGDIIINKNLTWSPVTSF